MAEVRKKVVEDPYDTENIKKAMKKKEEKKENKKVNTTKSKKKKEEKKTFVTRFRIFCNGVKSEFKRIHWTTKKDMIKYSVATIFFIIFFSVFFYLIDVIFALIQSLF